MARKGIKWRRIATRRGEAVGICNKLMYRKNLKRLDGGKGFGVTATEKVSTLNFIIPFYTLDLMNGLTRISKDLPRM